MPMSCPVIPTASSTNARCGTRTGNTPRVPSEHPAVTVRSCSGPGRCLVLVVAVRLAQEERTKYSGQGGYHGECVEIEHHRDYLAQRGQWVRQGRGERRQLCRGPVQGVPEIVQGRVRYVSLRDEHECTRDRDDDRG